MATLQEILARARGAYSATPISTAVQAITTFADPAVRTPAESAAPPGMGPGVAIQRARALLPAPAVAALPPEAPPAPPRGWSRIRDLKGQVARSARPGNASPLEAAMPNYYSPAALRAERRSVAVTPLAPAAAAPVANKVEVHPAELPRLEGRGRLAPMAVMAGGLVLLAFWMSR